MDHDNEPQTHTLHTRREFLRTSMLGAAAAWTLPVFLQKTFMTLDAMAADSPIQTPTGKDGSILVVLQLAGGNDGLNTIVPYADDAYYRARPIIGIPKSSVIPINDYIGFHPKLTGLKALYDQGHLALLQGVGYPNPNRSHFRSTEIWQTATDADKYDNHGWLGRYFDSCCKGADPTVGVSIGNEMPQSFVAANPTGVSFSRPEQYRWNNPGERQTGANSSESLYRELNAPEDMSGAALDANDGGTIGAIAGGKRQGGGSTLDFLERTALDAQMSSDKVREIAKKYRSTVEYPKGPLADSLSLVARMIAGGLATRVYYVSQGGYDTHTNQVNTHDRLMSEHGRRPRGVLQGLEGTGQLRPGDADDLQRIRPPGAAECQQRHRPRRGRADVRDRRRGQGRPVRPISEPYLAEQRRPHLQCRFPERLRDHPR